MAKPKEYLSLNSALILIGFIVIIISVFVLIGNIGVPFIGDSPDTFSAEDSVNIKETDTEVIVELANTDKKDNLDVRINNNVQEWNENNEVRVRKASLQTNIEVDSIVDGNVYETFVYNINEEQVKIQPESDTHLRNQTYLFNLISSNTSQSEFGPVEWTIEDEILESRSPVIEYKFNESGNYTFSAETRLNGVEYTVEETIRVLEPDEVVVEADSNKVEATILEEIMFNATEVSNESVEEFKWNFGDNSSVRTGEEIKYWYQEPGNYTVELSGTSSETGEVGTDEINVTITELAEDEEAYELSLNVFDGDRNKPLNNSDVSIDDVKANNTGAESHQIEFTLKEGEYEVIVNNEGYETKRRNVTLNDNKIVDIQLSQVTNNEGGDEEGEQQNNTTNTELEESPEENPAEFEQEEAGNIDTEEPSTLEQIINNMDGNGTTENPYIITTVSEFQAINGEPSASYALGNDINAISTQLWNNVGFVENEKIGTADETSMKTDYAPIINDTVELKIESESLMEDEDYEINYTTGEVTFSSPLSEEPQYSSSDRIYLSYDTNNVFNGFEPINASGNAIELDGQNHSINNLYINRPNKNNVGLFTEFEGGLIKDLKINGISVRGNDFVGGVIGVADGGILTNVNIGGKVTGNETIGGISGISEGTKVNDSSATISVTGKNNIGGVSGNINQDAIISSTFVQTAPDYNISGITNIGGITGISTGSTISNSHTLAIVEGQTNIGGIAGIQRSDSQINSVYTAGPIISSNNATTGSIVGYDEGSINKAYWDTSETRQERFSGTESTADYTSSVIEGLTTEEMKGVSAVSNMSELLFNVEWSVTKTYPKIYNEYTKINENLTGFDLIDSDRPDVEIDPDDADKIVAGDEINETPAHVDYSIFNETNYDVKIYESDVKVETFTVPVETTETRGSRPVVYTPTSSNYPSADSARLDGFNLDEENKTVNIYYTGLNESGEEIDKDTYSITTEVINSDGESINAQVTTNGETKVGSVNRFNRLLSDTYTVTVNAEGYQRKDITVSISGSDEFEEITLLEE